MGIIKGDAKNNKLMGETDVFGATNYIYGYGGDDTLVGGFIADNYIWGGDGNDEIRAGAQINKLYGEAGNDFLTGFFGGANTFLYGGSGSDTLEAGSGGQYLDGGTGADIMLEGAGGDTFIVDNAKDQVQALWAPDFDNQPNPVDTVKTKVSYSLDYQARIEVFETIDAKATTAINLAGSDIGQTIIGNAGKNVIDGKGGNDILVGGLGADTLIGGTGSDTASYSASTVGITVSLAKPSINNGEAVGDTFNSVENLLGSKFGDKLYGNGAANVLTAGAGDDYLYGAAGKDNLKGDAGNDKLNGGLDADTLTGGAGKDTFVFSTALGSANIDTMKDFNLTDDVIHLENAIFTALTKTGALTASQFVANASGLATDKLDRVIYETDTGKLFYDADGNGSGKAIQFATLKAGLALTEADFFVI